MVSHTLCRRGWLLLLARSTGISLSRCFSAKNAAAAGPARSLGESGLVKYPGGGGLASAGRSLMSRRSDFGKEGHRCKASNTACREFRVCWRCSESIALKHVIAARATSYCTHVSMQQTVGHFTHGCGFGWRGTRTAALCETLFRPGREMMQTCMTE